MRQCSSCLSIMNCRLCNKKWWLIDAATNSTLLREKNIMKEYIVEYFNKGQSIPLATRQFGYNEANARAAAKAEKGNDIIIRSTRQV